MNSRVARLLAVTAAATFMASAPAAAAGQVQSAAYSPWAALSAFAAPSSSQALCGMAASNAAAAAAASTTTNGQSGTPGCVLPVLDTPGPAPVVSPAPAPNVVGEALPKSFNAIPLLLGLAVLGAAAALALGNGNSNDSIVARPISPA